MLLQNRFNQVDAQIISIEEQIRQLQDSLSQLQTHRQHLQSVEQACESALTQVDTALMMLNHVDADCIATFKDAIMAKFSDGAIAQLPASPDDEPTIETEPEPSPEPTEPEQDQGQVITVETVESEPATDEPITDPTPEIHRVPASVGSAAFDINKASLDELKAFCSDITEEQAREYGALNRKTTWKAIAKARINGTL